MRLNINEIFYSLQGEGARSGVPAIFIRTQGCKVKHACFEHGVECDTAFEGGTEQSLDEIGEQISVYPSNNIIWTGGEPAQQIDEQTVQYFKDKGYYQSIETSGAYPIPSNLDYVCVSPKVAEHVLEKKIGRKVNELRYIIHRGSSLPQPVLFADHYFLSPHADGNLINEQNLRHCIQLCLENPQWRLSLQLHKIVGVL